MKVNRNVLYKMIAEAMGDEDLATETDFQKLMSAIESKDWTNINQVLEMYDLGVYELSPQEEEQVEKILPNAIIRHGEPDEVIPALINLNFDFRNEFTQVYGVTPPENGEFSVTDDTLAMKLQFPAPQWIGDTPIDGIIAIKKKWPKCYILSGGVEWKTNIRYANIRTVDGELLKVSMDNDGKLTGTEPLPEDFQGPMNLLEFHFWWEGKHPEHPSDPWIYIYSHPSKGGYENIYIDQENGVPNVSYEGDSGSRTDGNVRKKDLPEIIRKAMGWPLKGELKQWPGLPDTHGLINEMIDKNESDDKFQKLMDLANDPSEGSGIQALEMLFAFDLTEEQTRALYTRVFRVALKNNIEELPEVLDLVPEEYTEQDKAEHFDIAVNAILKAKENNPERLLKAIGYDFHKEFTEVFDVTPPRDQEFIFDSENVPWGTNGEDLYLVVPGKDNALVLFSLLFEESNKKNPSDPYIYLRSPSGEDESWIEWNPITDSLIYDTPEKTIDITKEQIPEIIKRETGVSFGEQPVNEKVDRNYLFRMINEVLREDEDDDADFTKKIQDFLDSKDLESLKSALNLLDIYAMSGLIDDEKTNDLKRKMYKVIKDERMVVDNPKAVYDFINSEEFSSSFDKFAMNDFRTETFDDVYIYGGGVDKIVDLVLPDFKARIEHYEGNPFNQHYVIEDLKNQEEADEILTRFKQFVGNNLPFAALVTVDGDPYILIGSHATSIANFGRDSREMFGYRPKTLPEVDGNVLKTEDGEGNPYLAKNSPLFDGEDVAYHVTIKKDWLDWVLHLIFDDGREGYMRIDYSDRKGFYEIVRNKSDERFFKKVNYWPTVMAPGGGPSLTKEEMLAKVKEITNIDLTDVGPSHYERDQMSESALEIEENFGRESRGEVLTEGWKEQWPNQFGYLLDKIKDSIGKHKADVFYEALVKIFYKVGKVKYLMPGTLVRKARFRVERYADSGIEEQEKKIDDITKGIEYMMAEPVAVDYPKERIDQAIKELQLSLKTEQEVLDKFKEFKALATDSFGDERRKQEEKKGRAARKGAENDVLSAMRVSNNLIKSIKKQLNKWKKNVSGTEVYSYVGYALTDFDRAVKSQEDWAYNKTFEGDLAVLVQFIKKLRGNQEDLGKKLMSLIDNNKDTKEVEFIKKINNFIDESRQNEFVDCKDTKGDVPCVFLRLDDGTYWHRTSVDYCEITQNKMANCGAASDPTGMLYNLMSDGGGITKYYITLEYSKSKNKVIQVLGKANTLPKEKYWPAITSFFEAMGNPLLSKDAFVHMYNDVEDEMTKEELDQRIQEFVEGIGARMIPPPAIESWDAMKQQIRENYYSDVIEDPVLGGGRVGNTYRASIIYGGEDDGKVKLLLKIHIILQTVTNDTWEQWRLSNHTKETQKIKEYSETDLLRKAIYEAIPEKYVDPAREIHFKYSKSADPTLKMNSNGAYRIRTSYLFETRTGPWNKARGEYLVENFDQITEGVANNLKRAALSVLFDIAPKRAALVYPEEAKRLADVEDILRDMGFNEGKKKQKLDRNYLTSMIMEVLRESKDK